jgi:AbrB family looped-hinge helix DNA binding protein
MEVYGTVRVGERGQVVIPSGARAALGVKPGDSLLVISTPHRDGVVMIKAEVVKMMVQKMNLGLSQTEDGSPRSKPSRRRR